MPQVIIKITENSSTLYSQFKASYLNDKKETIRASNESKDDDIVIVNKNDTISVNVEAIKIKLENGNSYLVDGLFSIFAHNPNKGALLTITKVQHQLLPTE